MNSVLRQGSWSPFWLGLSVAIGVLLLRCALDGLYLVSWGLPDGYQPLWRSNIWWPEIVNATLMGYIPAALAVARRGIDRDVTQLRPKLLCNDTEVTELRSTASKPSGLGGRMFKLAGLVGGAIIVFVDPSITFSSEPSLTNPAFIWPLLRIPVFTWLICTLFVFDFNATRTYLHMGRDLVEVDLLDIQFLSPFARKGLRSALTWVLFSIVLSLFWLGEHTASQQNFSLLVTLLTMATVTFLVPLIGVHKNILQTKSTELDRLREQIRTEHAAFTSPLSDENRDSPRLANQIAYYQLVGSAREWPIDAASLLRFLAYLFIGLGSWLGGAVVERMLDSALTN
jgi:hypothetical protein